MVPDSHSESDRRQAVARGGQARPLRPAVRSRVVDLRCVNIPLDADPAEDVELAHHRCGGVKSPSVARQGHASAAVAGKLYVFGGIGAEGRLSTAEVYDPASDNWAQGSSSTSSRSYPVAVAL